ncbi:MAG TPA: Gfo/Idh/MocA family oxidoreductase [Bacteroidota bacterium]|nr:Gfo/Idh/MocA family oxidoreductase [Bacteroidota bacterium]
MKSSPSKIRYGILGLGLFAERAIAPAIRASSNSELIAIQKRSMAAANAKAKELSIPLAFDSVEKLVAHNDVDAVYIVSANAFHAPSAIAAARAKKHVLVEKPMAMNAAEARKMIAACKQHRVKLMVGHMLRLSPLVRRMRDIVQSGMIGDITAARADFVYDGKISHRTWLLDRKLAGGGPVYDIGVHGLDTLRFILNDEVVSVKSDLSPRPTAKKTEESANIILRFSRGTLASIYCSFAAPLRRTFIEFIGTKGIISAYGFTQNNATISLRTTMGIDGKEQPPAIEEVVVPNLYIEQITRFSTAIIEGTEPYAPGSTGLKNQIVLDAVMKEGK